MKYIDKITKLLNEIFQAFEQANDPNSIRAKSILENSPSLIMSVIDNEISETSGDDREFVLDTVLKNQFERAFDADLTDLKIHTGSYAEMLTKKNGAEAVTMGSDIYFGAGKYAPDTEEGMNLLAHEIQHFIQFQKKERMVYLEDIEKAEYESSKTENMMTLLKLHDVQASALSQSDVPGINKNEEAKETEAQIVSSNGAQPSLGDFSKRYNKPVYEVILKSGEKVILTKEELDQVYHMFMDRINDHIMDLKTELTEDEYAKKMIKIMKELRR